MLGRTGVVREYVAGVEPSLRDFSVKVGAEVTMQMQERAYTSPIWYTPSKQEAP